MSVEDNIRAILEFTGLNKDSKRKGLKNCYEFVPALRKVMASPLGGERRRCELPLPAVDPNSFSSMSVCRH